MPPETSKDPHTLADSVDFLTALSQAGLDVIVIGGCAVGAYAALRGESVISRDLDVYTTLQTQLQIMDWASSHGVRIVKRPQPRALSVVFLDWRGLEVNVLTESSGLPPPAEAFQRARLFRLEKQGGISALIVDPYDLLRCKLKVNREKDRPHQVVLRRFLEDEAVEAFRSATDSRDRIAPSQRLVEVLGEPALPDSLARRLLPLARTPSDYRFLVGQSPGPSFAREVLAMLPDGAPLRLELETILNRRHGDASP